MDSSPISDCGYISSVCGVEGARVPSSFEEVARCNLLVNIDKEDILWSPSWTYAPLATARQVWEALQKRKLIPENGLLYEDSSGKKPLLEDLLGYLVLKWLMGVSLLSSIRTEGIKFKQFHPKDCAGKVGLDNEVVKRILQVTPNGIGEIGLPQLTSQLPEDFKISPLSEAESPTSGIKFFGITLVNKYCRITIKIYAVSFTRPVIRSGPAPILAGMPIDAIDQDYYLKQIESIGVATFIMVFRGSYTVPKLVLRPFKTQQYIQYISNMADDFKVHFDWETCARRATQFREKEMYEVVKTLKTDIQRIQQKLEELGNKPESPR